MITGSNEHHTPAAADSNCGSPNLSAHQSAAELGELPVVELLSQIKNRHVRPKLLRPEDRRRCVEVLHDQGYSQAEIAKVLDRNERTIRRDLEQVRDEHALTPDPGFAPRMIGDLMRNAFVSASHLRRIAHEAGNSAMERLMAESSAWKIFRELFEKLQSAGFLPRVPAGVVAEVYQHGGAGPPPEYEELDRQVQEICQLALSDGRDDAEGDQRRLALRDELNRHRLAAEIKALQPSIGAAIEPEVLDGPPARTARQNESN